MMSRFLSPRSDLPWALLALALTLGMGLMAAYPFLSNAGLPAATDAELHVYRIAELGYSLRAGNLYPRWAPNFFHGYGYPIFNYYAPLTYHLGNWLTLVQPEHAAVGARLLFILTQVLGAIGAYLLGALFHRRGGGLLGALCFICTPYILLINSHVRGDLPESLALAFVPWALWGWELLWRRGTPASMLAAIATTSVAFLSHNLTGLTLVVLVAGLGLWRLLIPQRADASGHLHAPGVRLTLHPYLGRAVAAAIVFVLLTAFFWLPFLAERRFIQLDVAGDGHYDFRNHFVSVSELLAWLQPIDRRASAPDVPMTVGGASVVIALIGAIAAVARRRFRETGFYIVASVGLFWMMTPSSRPLWEALPGIEFYQFPWRFLGPLAALLVPLAGSVVLICHPPARSIGGRRLSAWRQALCLLPAIAAAWLLMGAFPGFYPPPWDAGFGLITPETIIEAELVGRWRGTTSTNDFVPTTVDMIPGPQSDLLASYAQPPIDRVNRHTLPEGVQVDVVPSVPWVNRFTVRADQDFRLRLYLFDFPGWKAYLDGQPVEIDVARPEGYVTIPVSAGTHEVLVRFESTPARRLAWGMTGGGVVASLLILLGARTPLLKKRSALQMPVRESPALDVMHDRQVVLSLAATLVLVVLVQTVLRDPTVRFAAETPLGQAPADTTPQYAVFRDEIALLGYEIAPRTVVAGQTLDVKLVWMAQRPLSVTYQSFVHLVYPEGKIMGQSDHLNPGGYPTNLWSLDRYIVDAHQIRIPRDADAGTYMISVGLYSLDTGLRVPVRSAVCGYRPESIVLCNTVRLER